VGASPSTRSSQHGSTVRVVVEVMPKPEILDPQGKAVRGALTRLGFAGVSDVRQGKRFEIDIDGEVDPGVLDRVRTMAETLLANPVIEDFTVRTEAAADAPPVPAAAHAPMRAAGEPAEPTTEEIP
jgi:phosphoribosylformylglycinamidine synthase PurS subunit